jgi:hypothetical protein
MDRYAVDGMHVFTEEESKAFTEALAQDSTCAVEVVEDADFLMHHNEVFAYTWHYENLDQLMYLLVWYYWRRDCMLKNKMKHSLITQRGLYDTFTAILATIQPKITHYCFYYIIGVLCRNDLDDPEVRSWKERESSHLFSILAPYAEEKEDRQSSIKLFQIAADSALGRRKILDL